MERLIFSQAAIVSLLCLTAVVAPSFAFWYANRISKTITKDSKEEKNEVTLEEVTLEPVNPNEWLEQLPNDVKIARESVAKKIQNSEILEISMPGIRKIDIKLAKGNIFKSR